MRKADPGAGEDQQAADPPSRRIVGLRRAVQLGLPDQQPAQAALKEGQVADLKVLEVDPIHHRLVLAATGYPPEPVIPPPPPPPMVDDPAS